MQLDHSSLDVATTFTLEFVRNALPPGCRRVLEVGCGDGRLAGALRDAGLIVTAVDEDAEAVALARRRGVDAVACDWNQFDSADRWDAILFTRSLHHIHDLDAALDLAAKLLSPGGVIVLEEFAFDAMDGATMAWLRESLRPLGPLEAGGGAVGFTAELQAAADPLSVWRRHFLEDHDLHPVAAIVEGLHRRFGTVDESQAAYLLRFAAHTAGAQCNPSALREFLGRELRAIADGAICPIGRRMVARGRRDMRAPRQDVRV
jgi:SAM-dependent methyltransferase